MSMHSVNGIGEALMASNWIFEELCVPADFGTRDVAAQAIALEARRRGGIEKAAKYILGRAIIDQRQGATINRFWFTDQKYLNKGPDNPGADNQREMTEAEAYQAWSSMSPEFKKANPWEGA